jgi:hypothetical protein
LELKKKLEEIRHMATFARFWEGFVFGWLYDPILALHQLRLQANVGNRWPKITSANKLYLVRLGALILLTMLGRLSGSPVVSGIWEKSSAWFDLVKKIF